ncbi:TetR family transcriptional regulator [Streptomyces sp. NPDC091292]|uniref:TetR family transcriptional regulator n=1 Tax=Streptomyces sp. NPDC091292 TaxID=3365991 RepID=UPI00381F608A
MSGETRQRPPNGGRTKPAMRDALVAAALELFVERGFEQTTIDDIVALAGVGRRSFFRYFPSKEAVVFPDHERCLADMSTFLAAGAPDDDPVHRVCDAARLVARMYADNPAFSVRRYGLTRQVPGLRTHELSVVRRYERVLADFLRARFAVRPDRTLRADVVAASVVAAHNHALRAWLRSGGSGDVLVDVDQALEYVHQAWCDLCAAPGAGGGADGDPADDVVVVFARRGVPMWRLVQGVEAALGET